MRLNIEKDVFLPAYYPYLFDYSHRYEVYWGGRASGKTYFIIQKLLLKGLKEKRSILLMQKRTNAVKDTVWKELNLAIDRFQLRPYFELNKTDFRAICKITGTEFRCVGLDEPEKIKGYANISDVYLDEVTAFTEDDVELIDGTLRSKTYTLPLQMFFSFNPVSKANFVYKYWGFDTGIVPPDTLILHTTYLDNPRADSAKRMEALKQRNPQRWKIEALGEFVSLDKLVYTDWEIGVPPADNNFKLLCGLDWGFTNDPTAFVASLLDEENKILYVFKEWGATGKTNQDIAAAITNMGFAKSIIIGDSAEPKSCEELKRCGIRGIKPSLKGPDSINYGIDKVKQYKLVIHPDCEQVITELENYSWQRDKQTGEYINKPIDCWNHYLDALRYSLQSVGRGELRSIDRGLLGL